jgi:hypothetical protein
MIPFSPCRTRYECVALNASDCLPYGETAHALLFLSTYTRCVWAQAPSGRLSSVILSSNNPESFRNTEISVPPLASIAIRMNPVHTLPSCFFNNHFSIIFPSFLQPYLNKLLMYLWSVSFVLHVHPSHHPSRHCHINTR